MEPLDTYTLLVALDFYSDNFIPLVKVKRLSNWLVLVTPAISWIRNIDPYLLKIGISSEGRLLIEW